MSQFEKLAVNLSCLGCGKAIASTYYAIFTGRVSKCGKCGSTLKLNTSAVASLKAAAHDLERAQEKVAKMLEKVIDTAVNVPKK